MSERLLIIIALILTSGIMLALSVIAFRKKMAGLPAMFLSVCIAGVAVYSFGYAMELASNTLNSAIFWVRFQHWGIQLIAPAWLLFSLGVSGHEKRINAKLIILLGLIPVFLLIASQTLGWVNLGHHNPRLDTSGAFPIFTYDRNIFNVISFVYYSLCLTASTVLFGTMLFRAAPSFRRQSVIYLIGSLLPWFGALEFNLGFFNSKLDYTPLFFGVGGLILALGFLKYRILDIIPMARDTIFENMSTGVLILDTEDRIIDFNPSMKAIFPEIDHSLIGTSVFDAFTDHSVPEDLANTNSNERFEFQVRHGGSTLYYRISQSSMFHQNHQPAGNIISFYEYTQEKKLIEKLERLAAQDGLTGVYNRQYFDQLARKELSRVKRYDGVLSLIMMDLDDFKLINDTYGHDAGDQVLIAVANTLCKLLRQSDILARFGGEEFLILLPQTYIPEAVRLAERLRLGLEKQFIQYEGHSLNVQGSFGVTGITSAEDISLKALYRLADQASYKAKAAGRNCVCVSLPSDTLHNIGLKDELLQKQLTL